jgi:hypothetical protein
MLGCPQGARGHALAPLLALNMPAASAMSNVRLHIPLARTPDTQSKGLSITVLSRSNPHHYLPTKPAMCKVP